jgi:hypothetical protein
MAYFAWMAQEAALGNAALTVRAQVVSPNDTGRLLWDAFFPRRDVDSVKLANIAQIDFRPAADRREWNARGRQIPLRTPNIAEVELIPIEATFGIAEREIQELEERTLGNETLFRQLIRSNVPDRIDSLAQANFRRIEVDAFTAWALGQVTARNPVDGSTGTVSFNFAAARYETAGTAWNAVGNAYLEFRSWLLRAMDLIGGPIVGAMMRIATMNEIIADAPNTIPGIGAGIPALRSQVEARIADDIGGSFRFYINESTVDIFADGGLDVTRTKVWPTGRVAAVPQGETIGATNFAPVARAIEMSRANPQAEIDIRGMTAFSEVENGGRGVVFECQANVLTLPDESRVAVINAGI